MNIFQFTEALVDAVMPASHFFNGNPIFSRTFWKISPKLAYTEEHAGTKFRIFKGIFKAAGHT